VARNIATVPRLLGWIQPKISERVDELLRLLDLDPALYRTRYPHQLSGGQQQRVGVARALAGDPDVLLMDEPFGALDPVTRAALQSELKRIHQLSGKTIVMVTHDIDEALQLATRIVVIDRGTVLQVASPLQLLTQPANSFVADFLGRSDMGIKLLSLHHVADLMRSEAATAGPRVPRNASVREAISAMALHQVVCINVHDAAGLHLGVLHASDVFTTLGSSHA
jgi:osmoprotectant transport system ATP-binding protein